MHLLPVRIVPLASDLPPAALCEALRGVIGDGPSLPFTGAVWDDGFAITRMNEFRSTFMPLLRGNFSADTGGGTLVRLRLRPPGTVAAFMAIWLAFLAAVAAMIVAAHASDPGRSLLPLLAPALLGAGSWLLMTAVFAADSRWAVARLVELVPALHPDGTP